MNSTELKYIENIKSEFKYYKSVGDKTFIQLSETDLFWQFNKESNSIAIIVNHLYGNMKSRWTDFLTSDGEKAWRQREQEFELVIKSKSELLSKWEEGWLVLFAALETVNIYNFQTKIYIRNQEHSIFGACNRQLAHYAYHIGQITYIAKMIKGSQWTSLTIPKGQSKIFNEGKISKGKHDGHFSDDLK